MDCAEGKIWCVDNCLLESQCTYGYKFLTNVAIVASIIIMGSGFLAAIFLIVSYMCKSQKEEDILV